MREPPPGKCAMQLADAAGFWRGSVGWMYELDADRRAAYNSRATEWIAESHFSCRQDELAAADLVR